jgi:hypothetical protein
MTTAELTAFIDAVIEIKKQISEFSSVLFPNRSELGRCDDYVETHRRGMDSSPNRLI